MNYKTVDIRAEATLQASEAQEVAIIVTVPTDRFISQGVCAQIMALFYPNHQIQNVKFTITV
jgi:hypothetical protein